MLLVHIKNMILVHTKYTTLVPVVHCKNIILVHDKNTILTSPSRPLAVQGCHVKGRRLMHNGLGKPSWWVTRLRMDPFLSELLREVPRHS